MYEPTMVLNNQQQVKRLLFLFVSVFKDALKHQKTKRLERMNSGRTNVVEKDQMRVLIF